MSTEYLPQVGENLKQSSQAEAGGYVRGAERAYAVTCHFDSPVWILPQSEISGRPVLKLLP